MNNLYQQTILLNEQSSWTNALTEQTIFINKQSYWTNNLYQQTILRNKQSYWTNNLYQQTILLNERSYWMNNFIDLENKLHWWKTNYTDGKLRMILKTKKSKFYWTTEKTNADRINGKKTKAPIFSNNLKGS